ncbi:hypothetical protein [Alcanivorax sp.]|uniref:hypothetical protein n=1 Tax=Alcanivorax sp. TaxID=1872427 RepID=UPI003A952AE1
MEFDSEDDAKSYAISVTAKHLHPDDAQNRLDSYKTYQESAHSAEDKSYWEKEVRALDEYIQSDEFKNGEYPQGIDELILEIIEWRAAIYAFQNVDTEQDPFKEHAFYAQWLMGGTYTIFCILGKLVSKDNRDSSLRKLWSIVSGYVKNSGLCGEGENEIIEEKMHRTEGHFTNTNSRAMLFRNKVIAHNESSPKIQWVEIDKDIKLLCRIWALVTMWSSFGIIQPFRKSQQVFSGLESVFNPAEIKSLVEQRNVYLEKVESWCTHSLVDNSKVSERSPFGKISVSINIKPSVASNALTKCC